MQTDVLVSVIVPVYKVEKYISRCINSLLDQEFKNIEIIVVDDGSPDNSGKIIDELSNKDKRIVVVHKSNSGVSSARNTGINLAKGKYVMFVDGDDWVERNYVMDFVIFAEMNSFDIVMNYNYFTDNGYLHSDKECDEKSISKDKAAEYIYNGKIFVAVWNKIYNKQFLDKNKIKFHDDIWFGEGMLFNIECLNRLDFVGVINLPSYHQEANTNSAMRLFNLESYQCGLKSMEIQKNIISSFSSCVMDAWLLHNYHYHQIIIDGLVKSKSIKSNISVYKHHVKQLRKDIHIPIKYEIGIKRKIKSILYFLFPRFTSALLLKRHKNN